MTQGQLGLVFTVFYRIEDFLTHFENDLMTRHMEYPEFISLSLNQSRTLNNQLLKINASRVWNMLKLHYNLFQAHHRYNTLAQSVAKIQMFHLKRGRSYKCISLAMQQPKREGSRGPHIAHYWMVFFTFKLFYQMNSTCVSFLYCACGLLFLGENGWLSKV